jgi:prepilin-type N-terminal cleavage/methylation domain-containing protein
MMTSEIGNLNPRSDMERRFFALIVGRPQSRAFTLIELCVVLFILALLAAAAMPSMESAFKEQALRNDGHQLSMMVKTAVIQSEEQQRPYQLTLDGKELVLMPVRDAIANEKPDGNDGSAASQDSVDDQTDADVDSWTLGTGLKFPDATKKDTWESLPTVRWIFQPRGLCPLPRVRLEQGSAYLEMSFNALTGDVESQASYIP